MYYIYSLYTTTVVAKIVHLLCLVRKFNCIEQEATYSKLKQLIGQKADLMQDLYCDASKNSNLLTIALQCFV